MNADEKPGAGATIRYWLPETLRELRVDAGIRPEDVASQGGVGYDTIRRFERGDNWPHDFDRVVAAYAEALGNGDSRDLWERALERWRTYGLAYPLREKASAPASRRFVELIALQVERDRARAETTQRETSTAKRKRRVSG